jgi:ribonuclease P protein component
MKKKKLQHSSLSIRQLTDTSTPESELHLPLSAASDSLHPSSFLLPPSQPTRITFDRRHSLSGKKNLDWFFANRKWVRTAGNTLIEAAWATRELPEGEAGLRILILASKRSHKHAHDRNRIKRLLRATIPEVEDFARIETEMNGSGKQLLLMLRISRSVEEVAWEDVVREMRAIGEHLVKRVG